jgi:hypothetical protein
VYAGFFYWFTLRGTPLAHPQKQLICVLPDDNEEFNALHKFFDELPLETDGFFSSLDNVAVFAPARVDPAFKQFNLIVSDADKQLGDQTQGNLTLNKLLRDSTAVNQRHMLMLGPDQLDKARILALAAQAAQEEGEVNATTHEGIVQLAVATGVLPRRVLLPTAVKYGFTSFFHTPKSQFAFKDLESPAYFSGMGGPHWVHLPFFRKLVDAERKGEVILNEKTTIERKLKIEKMSIPQILGDASFERAQKADDKEKPVLEEKARAEAWALTYFLARNKLDQYRKFLEGLGRLPRDMELTPEIVELVFAQAFGLVDRSNPDKINTDGLASLEREWREYMELQQLYINTVQDKKDPKQQQQQPQFPGQFGPGGFGPGGPGS